MADFTSCFLTHGSSPTPLSLQRAHFLCFCLFGVLHRFQHCTGHITTGSWKGRGNQYIEFARVLYCKLPTNGKQLPAFPLQAMTGIEPRPQRWEARVLPLCHHGPSHFLWLSNTAKTYPQVPLFCPGDDMMISKLLKLRLNT